MDRRVVKALSASSLFSIIPILNIDGDAACVGPPSLSIYSGYTGITNLLQVAICCQVASITTTIPWWTEGNKVNVRI